MPIPEPSAANWTSFLYTQRASTLVLEYQAYKTRIQLRYRIHEVVLTFLLCGNHRVARKIQTRGAILNTLEI